MKPGFARLSEVAEGQMTEAAIGSANAVSVSQSGGNLWALAQVAFAIVAGEVLWHFALAAKMKLLGKNCEAAHGNADILMGLFDC